MGRDPSGTKFHVEDITETVVHTMHRYWTVYSKSQSVEYLNGEVPNLAKNSQLWHALQEDGRLLCAAAREGTSDLLWPFLRCGLDAPLAPGLSEAKANGNKCIVGAGRLLPE